MVPGISSAECEAAFGGAAGVDYAMVVVEDFIHGDGHAEVRVGFVAGEGGVELFGFVFTWGIHERVWSRGWVGVDLPTTRVSFGSSS